MTTTTAPTTTELAPLNADADIKRFRPADAAIAEMAQRYMPLKIRDVNDSTGFQQVHSARMVVKTHRVNVEKTRKALKEDALKYGRVVDAEAKRITALLQPIEQHLQEQEDAYNAARAKIKAQRLQERMDKLAAVEAVVASHIVEPMNDANFDLLLSQKTQEFRERKERERLEAEEKARQEAEAAAARKAEEERLQRERDELEAERKRLAAEEAERKRQEEERLKAEREKLEEERRKLREEQERLEAEKREAELQRAREEAAEKARQEAEDKARLDEEERVKREIAEREERERREALRPTREKLLVWVDGFHQVYPPDSLIPGADARKEIFRLLRKCEADIREVIDIEYPPPMDQGSEAAYERPRQRNR